MATCRDGSGACGGAPRADSTRARKVSEARTRSSASRAETGPPRSATERRVAEAAYAHLGLRYEVVTEEDILDGAKLANALLIARHACVAVPDPVALRIRLLLSTGAAEPAPVRMVPSWT